MFKQLLQAQADRRRPARRLPGGGDQREPGHPAAGREVRRAGLPARRRGRAVRAGPAPRHVRLRRGGRIVAGPLPGVRRPPARALRRPGRDQERTLRRPAEPRDRCGDAQHQRRAIPLSPTGRPGPHDAEPGAGWSGTAAASGCGRRSARSTSGCTPRSGPRSSRPSSRPASATTRSSCTTTCCSATTSTPAPTTRRPRPRSPRIPATRRWWALTDPCQERLPGTPEGEQWLPLPEVWHLSPARGTTP